MSLCKKTATIALAAIAATTLTACPADREDVDQTSVQQNIEQNVRENLEQFAQSSEFLENVPAWQRWQNLFVGIGDRALFDPDLGARTDQLVDFLTNDVFIEENILEQDDDMIVYQLRGETFCARLEADEGLRDWADLFVFPRALSLVETIDVRTLMDLQNLFANLDTGLRGIDNGADLGDGDDLDTENQALEHNASTLFGFGQGVLSDCVSQINEADIRLEATSPEENDIDVRVLLGDSDDELMLFEFYQERLSVETDYSRYRDLLVELAEVNGADVQEFIPETMEGRLRAELRSEGDQRSRYVMNILDDIRFVDGRQELLVDSGSNVFEFDVNGQDEVMNVNVNIPSIEHIYAFEGGLDDAIGEPVDDENGRMARLRLDNIGFNTEFSVEQDEDALRLTNVNLGDNVVRFDIDEEQVFALDIDTNEIIVRELDDQVELAFGDDFELRMRFSFDQLEDELDGVQPWMQDEVITLRFDEADEPRILLRDDFLVEVLDGRLVLESQFEDTELVAEPGECLTADAVSMRPDPAGDRPAGVDPDDTDDTDDTDDPEDVLGEIDEDVDDPRLPEAHPFTRISVSSC
ncbi:MAG: hypothetical protein H0U74_22865 [Bradymonadaceae bacterium]|nr:hypothetical protein [Lujinxingiaceae bacterium]